MPQIFVNPPNDYFAECVNSPHYVDKSGLIRYTNSVLGSPDRRIVVTRPRRFGKTMALTMLAAYYSRGCDSQDLFTNLSIGKDPSFEAHLNQHNAILLDVSFLYSQAKEANKLGDFPGFLSETVHAELAALFPGAVRGRGDDLVESLLSIHRERGASVLFLVDEWDILFRDVGDNEQLIQDYLRFLVSLFHNPDLDACVEMVYLTGILPIPPCGDRAGLTNFRECTVFYPFETAEYFGFTTSEVEYLCGKTQMSPRELRDQYEGYRFGSSGPLSCPWSIVNALSFRQTDTWWNDSGPGTQLLNLMKSSDLAFQKAARDLMTGLCIPVDTAFTAVDLSRLTTLNDHLLALTRLGYLDWRADKSGVVVPNQEVTLAFLDAFEEAHPEIRGAFPYDFTRLNTYIREGDTEAVDTVFTEVCRAYSRVFPCAEENDLAMIILLACETLVFSSRSFSRLFPDEKGFAAWAFLPKEPDRKPIVVALRWSDSAESGLRPILDEKRSERLGAWPDMTLVDITCASEGVRHFSCVIHQAETGRTL